MYSCNIDMNFLLTKSYFKHFCLPMDRQMGEFNFLI